MWYHMLQEREFKSPFTQVVHNRKDRYACLRDPKAPPCRRVRTGTARAGNETTAAMAESGDDRPATRKETQACVHNMLMPTLLLHVHEPPPLL